MARILFILLGLLFTLGCLSNAITTDDNETMGLNDRYNRLGINPLPDAIPVFDDGAEYVLTDPTDVYKHGVLGDTIEASSLTIIDEEGIRKIDFTPQVFEGLFPLVTDFNGDGRKEIIATLSGNGSGAQLAVFNHTGGRIASSDVLPSGWRHALSVAEFGPNGELELIDIAMPHVRREVEFFQLKNGELVKVASIKGYSTHRSGSRNLGLFGVIEEDGRFLLIVPTADFNSIAAISRTDGGAVEVWRKQIDEPMQDISVVDGELFVNGEEVNY